MTKDFGGNLGDNLGVCCDGFRNMMSTFRWFSYKDDDKTMLVMPSIDINEKHWRINFCPSCGKECRSFTIEKEEYVKLTEHE